MEAVLYRCGDGFLRTREQMEELVVHAVSGYGLRKGMAVVVQSRPVAWRSSL
jgi:hypothetical protein